MPFWAIDLGTHNTAVARWDVESARPRLIELSEICRKPDSEDPMEAPRLIPTATHLVERPDFWTRVGVHPLLAGRVLWGRQAQIGRAALDLNKARDSPNFVPSFKRWLGRASLAPLTRLGSRAYTAREVATIFLRELIAETKRVSGERIRELVITAPVDAYEGYRAELGEIGRRLGITKLRFVDEPVAAAIGYGLSIDRTRRCLVVDFGAGTVDIALVELSARDVEAGTCRVIAKTGRRVGGNQVDAWLLDAFCQRLDYRLPEGDPFWRRLMLAEARWVKESVFFRESETFYLRPPEEYRALDARIRGPAPQLEVDQATLREILERRGLYAMLRESTEAVLSEAEGLETGDVDDVLMVGGSTLLPGVYGVFEERFGRDRVRAWQPFEAVVYGACALAAGRFRQSDLIVHDYAFLTYDANTHEAQHTVIIPRGTRIPTPPDLWKRQLVPTCSLGEPETLFKLVICEIGRAEEDQQFGWDTIGQVHQLKGGEPGLVVPLNESNPTLGYLNPPHLATDRRPRLEISFGVNAERWLCATVLDLRTKRHLMRDTPVVRLL